MAGIPGNPLRLVQDADNEMVVGAELYRQGDFAKAVTHFKSAEELYQSRRNDASRCDALIDLAAALAAIGHYPEAEQSLKNAIAIATARGDKNGIGSASAALASIYIITSRTVDAQTILTEAKEALKDSPDSPPAIALLDGLGSLEVAKQQFPQAIDDFRSCSELAAKRGDRMMEFHALSNAARSAAWGGDDELAGTLCQTVLSGAGSMPAGHEKTRVFLLIGQTLCDLARPGVEKREKWVEAARQAYQYAESFARASDDSRSLSYALGYEGRLEEVEGHADAALTFTRQAAFKAQQLQAPEVLYRWQWQTGRLLRAKGQTPEAIHDYSNAIDTLAAVRQDLALGYGNLGSHGSFRETVGPLFYELADMLLHQASSSADADQTQKLLRQARQTVEMLKTAEMDDYLQDPCANILKAKARTLENVDRGTAVIYLIPLADRTELLVGIAGELRQVVSPVSADVLYTQVRLFRKGLEERTTRRYLTSAKQLYDWLIRPIEPILASQHIDTLVFVPDGVLRNVPMAALHDGKNFLISQYAVAMTPGLTLIDPHPLARRGMQVLEAGLSQPVRGYPALAFVVGELNALHGMFPGETLLDQQFVSGRISFEMAKTRFTVIHIASHAECSGDIRKTFLVTYDSNISLEELHRLMRPSLNPDRPIDLLTLSACQTAAGDDRAALGLAGMALKAGARSTLATLWTVNDQAGSLLINDFYSSLRRDPLISKAKALQQAQMKMVSDLRYRHPGYWAPYILVGNWL